MKKVGIVSITDNNLGNRLQNLAVQLVLKRKNVKVETIRNYGCNMDFEYNNSLKEYKKVFFKNKIKALIGKFNKKYRKFSKFAQFDKNIKWSKFKLCAETDYKNINDYYDYFIVGSDQVWNPLFWDDVMYNNFLQFTEPDKKITFAPSLGVDYIPEHLKELYQKGFQSFNEIYLRESTTVELVKGYTNSFVDWTFDPTLFLTDKEWSKYSKKVKIKKPFILKYFLGDISQKYQEEIQEFALNNDFEIINIDFNKVEDVYSPSEFIWLIKNAQAVFTDSFHGCVLSFIFEKRFIIYERSGQINMSSRIQTLVNNLGIGSNLRKNMKKLDLTLCIDSFNKRKKIVKKKNEEFLNYLDKKLR